MYINYSQRHTEHKLQIYYLGCYMPTLYNVIDIINIRVEYSLKPLVQNSSFNSAHDKLLIQYTSLHIENTRSVISLFCNVVFLYWHAC